MIMCTGMKEIMYVGEVTVVWLKQFARANFMPTSIFALKLLYILFTLWSLLSLRLIVLVCIINADVNYDNFNQTMRGMGSDQLLNQCCYNDIHVYCCHYLIAMFNISLQLAFNNTFLTQSWLRMDSQFAPLQGALLSYISRSKVIDRPILTWPRSRFVAIDNKLSV